MMFGKTCYRRTGQDCMGQKRGTGLFRWGLPTGAPSAPAQHRTLRSPSPNPLHCDFLSPCHQPTPIPDSHRTCPLPPTTLLPWRSDFPTLASPSPLGHPRLGREGHTLHWHPAPSLHHVFYLRTPSPHVPLSPLVLTDTIHQAEDRCSPFLPDFSTCLTTCLFDFQFSHKIIRINVVKSFANTVPFLHQQLLSLPLVEVWSHLEPPATQGHSSSKTLTTETLL